MSFSPIERRRLIRMVNQFAAGRGRLVEGASGFLKRIFQQAPESQWYSGDGVDEFVQQAVSQSQSAQDGVVKLTDAYLDWVLNELGADESEPASVGENLRGVDQADVWERPVEQYRYARSQGADRDNSLEAALARIDALADGDVRLAERVATKRKLESAPKVRGYRRMVHPELSKSGSCGLCVAAADRFYSVKDLLPIHPNCECTVLPVIGSRDPKALNPVDYTSVIEVSDAHKDAAGKGGTKHTKVDLGGVRIRVEQHSELGAMLVYEKGSLHLRRLVPAAEAA